MPSLLKFSEASLLAIHALTFLAVHKGKTVNAPELAQGCASSATHMAKVCQRLNRAGLIQAVRGKQGGFRLEKPAASIRLSQVLQAFGEDLSPQGCLLAHATCRHGHEPACIFGPELGRLQASLSAYFRRSTVAQLARRCQGMRDGR